MHIHYHAATSPFSYRGFVVRHQRQFFYYFLAKCQGHEPLQQINITTTTSRSLLSYQPITAALLPCYVTITADGEWQGSKRANRAWFRHSNGACWPLMSHAGCPARSSYMTVRLNSSTETAPIRTLEEYPRRHPTESYGVRVRDSSGRLGSRTIGARWRFHRASSVHPLSKSPGHGFISTRPAPTSCDVFNHHSSQHMPLPLPLMLPLAHELGRLGATAWPVPLAAARCPVCTTWSRHLDHDSSSAAWKYRRPGDTSRRNPQGFWKSGFRLVRQRRRQRRRRRCSSPTLSPLR